jgi:hypothetical protein
MQGFEEYSVEARRLFSKPVFYIGSETSRSDTHQYIQATLKKKNERCTCCSLGEICSGVWKEYAEMYDTNELFPVFISKNEVIKKIRER